MKRLVITAAVLALPLLIAACNTIAGAGEDVSAGGKAIANTADKTKDNMDNSSGQ